MRLSYKLKVKIIIITIILFNVTNCISSRTEDYTNNKVGFKIIIPKELSFRTDEQDELFKSDGLYKISISINEIEEIKKHYDFDGRYKKLQKKEGFIFKFGDAKYDNGSLEYFEYKGKIIGQILLHIGYPNTNQAYFFELNFKKDNYFIGIYLWHFDSKGEIPQRYPDYFEREDMNINGKILKGDYYWKEPLPENCKKFYNLIKTKSKKAPKELIKLEEYFDEIVNSLELFDPTVVYYTPTVKKLSFREGSSLEDKRIRMLTTGEKLEILEKGKTETIGDATGTWVKVKTEQGEVGWCFDAYITLISTN